MMKFTLTSLSMLTAASICYAQSGLGGKISSDIKDLQDRVAALEQTPTPPVHPNAKRGTGLFVTGEALYWRASEEGLAYGITGPFNLVTASPTFVELDLGGSKTLHPDFDWDWGFRVGIGYDTPYDGWDLYGTWTRFHTHDNGSHSVAGDPNANDFVSAGSGSGNYISPFFVAQLFSPPGLLSQAKAHWRLNLDLADLVLGREFKVSKFLSLRPFLGIRSAWIRQNYNLSFLAFNFPSNPSALKRDIEVKMKNDFWGIGGRLGLDTRWFLGKGLSVYANGAFSLLDGFFHTRYQLEDQNLIVGVTQSGTPVVTTTVTPAFDDTFENKNRVHTVSAMLELGAGLRWEIAFNNDRNYFSIWAGYEYNLFFEQNQFMNYQNDFTVVNVVTVNPLQNNSNGPFFSTDRGNLSTSGLTTGVEFGF